jgi:hypothetical protein
MAPITVTQEEVAQYGKLTEWQRLIFIKDHWPQIFWPEIIGIVLAIGVVVSLIVASFVFGRRLWSWLLRRTVSYVQGRYPNEWSSRSVFRQLWGIGALLIVATVVVFGIATRAMLVTPFGLPLMFFGIALLEGAHFTYSLQTALARETNHVFSPKNESIAMLLTTIDELPPKAASPFRFLGVPTAATIRCRICGELQTSDKHRC